MTGGLVGNGVGMKTSRVRFVGLWPHSGILVSSGLAADMRVAPSANINIVLRIDHESSIMAISRQDMAETLGL